MEYRALDQAEYDRKLRMVIVGAEGLHADVQNVGDGRATIGWGYTLNRNNNTAIWRDAGIDLTQEQWRTLAAVGAAPRDDKTRVGLTFSRQLDGAESDRLLRASMAEYEAPANGLQMPLSDERVAVVSLAYNRGAGMLNGIAQSNVPEHPVMDAIRDSNRAEAWFQVRYNCWGSDPLDAQYPSAESNEGGLRKRRFAEAEVFGLYDDPANVTSDEARGVYRMFQLHRDEINRVERDFGVTVEGEIAGRNRLAQANRDYPGLVTEYGRVDTIAEALGPARTVLLGDLRREHPDLADRLTEANFDAGRIHLDPGRSLQDGVAVDLAHPGNNRTQNAVRREQHHFTIQDTDDNHVATLDSKRMTRGNNPREIDSNDLLIGGGGDDTLKAQLGNDILIDGAGRDRMEGGVGQDIYVANVGDTVMDNDGRGELRWRNDRGRDELLDGGTRVEGGPANTYRSANGQFTYVVDGTNLTVTNGQGESLQVENYARGDLGLRLNDTPVQTPGTVRAGQLSPEQRAEFDRTVTTEFQTAGVQRADPPPTQDNNIFAIERLSPQQRTVFDQMLTAVQRAGGYTEEQTQNIAAAGLVEFKRRESLVREPQDVGVYGDRLFTTYFPHGRDREPNFHANVRLEDVANTPAHQTLQPLDTPTRQQAIASPAQEREQPQGQEAGRGR